MRGVALHYPTKAKSLSSRPADRTGAAHAGHFHAGPRLRLVRAGHRLRLCLRTALDFDAFSSREPVTTSLENALEERSHDLRLFTRRDRFRRPAVLFDLRPAAAGTVLTPDKRLPRNGFGTATDHHHV